MNLRFSASKMILLFLAILFITPVILGVANYSGVCIPAMYILSDQEKINKIISVANAPGEVAIPIDASLRKELGIKSDRQYFKKIPYGSVEEYIKANPNCCYLRSELEGLTPSGSQLFWNRIFGLYAGVMYLHNPIRYLDAQGQVKTVDPPGDGGIAYYINNCGDVSTD